KTLIESVLLDQVAQGKLHQHPPASKRTGVRYGVGRPDPKEFLRQELSAAFARLEQLGFTPRQLREGALELLHEGEWAAPPAAAEARMPAAEDERIAASPQMQESAEAGAPTSSPPGDMQP